jgi:hypothetical protein
MSDAFDLMTPEAQVSISNSLTPSDGEGTDQFNYAWADKGQLAASGTVTIDLIGSETGPFGNTMNLSKLKYIQVNNTSDDRSTPTDSEISVSTNGIGFLSGTTPKAHIDSGGCFINAAFRNGWTLTNGSADTITITNEDTEHAATYELVVLGVETNASSSSSSSSEALNSSSSSSST